MHVVSTAGHVDHGKSALIERLTGIDPDRLAEEKARGLTIDLGFAWLVTPEGREVGIVDVPGHERFVHNMLAGVGSVDTTIFVVAANEGWMPQSEEHLAILDLLGARTGVVALTKADLVERPNLEKTKRAVAERLEGTPLEDAPIVACSAVTGEGLDELLGAIDEILARAGAPPDRGRPRLCVDRAFTIKGAGTVVTGTLTGGRLRAGDEVLVLPGAHRARIRGLQTHNTERAEALPVSRVALNLGGLERAEVRRGDAVVLPGQWEPTTELDVRLRVVRALDHELTNRGAYKAHIGSAEVDARLSLFEVESLRAGDEAFARLTLAEAVVAAPLDHVVLRDTGRRATVAGGAVLDAHPVALGRRAQVGRVEQLRRRANASADEMPSLVVAERGHVARADLPSLSGSNAEPSGVVATKTLVFSKSRFDELTARIVRALGEFHAREPLAQGIPKEGLRTEVRIDDVRVLSELLDSIPQQVVAVGPLLRLSTHRVTLTPEQDAAQEALFAELREARFSPPGLVDIRRRYGEKLVRALLERGALVKVADGVVLGADELDEAKRLIAQAVAREGPLTPARIKDLLDTTRKYAIPLLEHLDRTGFTRRRGDVREIR